MVQHFEFLVIRNIEFSDKGINSYRNGSKRAEYEALTALNGASMQWWSCGMETWKKKMGPFEGNGWKSLLLELTLSYYWPPFYGENLPLDWVTTGLKPSWERVRSTLRNEATWRLDIDKLSTCKPTQQDIFTFHFIWNCFQKRQNMLGIKAYFQNSRESKK